MQQSDFRVGVLRKEYFRRMTGQIVSSIVAESKSLRVEFLRRQYSDRSLWHFRQPSLVLLWYRTGVKKYHLDIDGRSMDVDVEKGSDLLLIPPDTEVNGEFNIKRLEGVGDYSITFFDRSLFGRLNPELRRARRCLQQRSAEARP